MGATDILKRLVDRVTRALTDASRNNPLIYYRDNRSTRFSLPPLGSDFVAKLLAGGTLSKHDFPVTHAIPEAPIPSVAVAVDDIDANVGSGAAARSLRGKRKALVDPLQSRLQKTRAKAKENEEERGLPTLFVAVGMVTWPATDGGRAPLAPLFLVPVTVAEDKTTRGEFVVSRVSDGDIVINRALLTIAPVAFREAVQSLFEDGIVEDVTQAYGEIQTAISSIDDTLILNPAAAIGIFNYSMMAVVNDLYEAGDALADHVVIRALAGDLEAQNSLANARDGSIDVESLDKIPPIDEPFVLDADPWQTSSIQTLLKFPESHATIDGPPGTGKSQTIANLIASLIAQGKSVLFCCEKRAALDVVKRRLAAVGLDHLVLDMHGAGITRQRAYAQLRKARAELRNALPASDADDAILIDRRERLNAHVRFMHTPLPDVSLSPFQLLSEIAALPNLAVSIRLEPEKLREFTPSTLSRLQSDLAEASRSASIFLRNPAFPWSEAHSLVAAGVPRAIEQVAQAASSLTALRDALRRIGIEVRTRAELSEKAARLLAFRNALAVCSPAAVALEASTLTLAANTLASPFGFLQKAFSRERRAAVRAVAPHLNGLGGAPAAAALNMLANVTEPWRSAASVIAALPDTVDATAASFASTIAAAEKALCTALPDDLDVAIVWASTCATNRDGAYRAARMREIEASVERFHLGNLLPVFATLPPTSWASAVRFVYLQSYLEPLRPALMRFDGRTHDDIVRSFVETETALRSISAERVRRVAGQRFITVSSAHRDQETALNVQLERVRSKKPLRALVDDSPNVLLALAPCVMASPLSISQFLPRKSMFDVVIFDEGSQVTPESAITAILRGRRVVIAGDDRQLPPTDFFSATVDFDDDDADEAIAVAGTESILTALRPFTKALGLRVHYRSRDERLIAFSNHHLYGDELVTFPGSGVDDQGLRFVHVPPSGLEIDEDSSSPEVTRVVDLIIEHAETRANESLGVIALGAPHARRIETLLAAVRRERPDLDAFFDETGTEPFFVKNLERVQGDERDAVILTIGYGRTKTGFVSHNFGPINQEGGERRLNVAITRAKSRLTLVASFRKIDLNPSSLNSVGAKLLAAYIGYAESGGRDLGRDVADANVPPNAFELDIQSALEQRLGTTILPQYGVGKFRIDLAVQHPTEPGRFVMAVESDGASYHNQPTARLRDRLRQRVLEDLGWHFCRIWSTDWFNNRSAELDRVERAYKRALDAASQPTPPIHTTPAPASLFTPKPPSARRTEPCPAKPPYRSIADISDRTLSDLAAWVCSDGRLRTDDDILREMNDSLGFNRRGARIVERLTAAIKRYRNTTAAKE